MCSMGAAWLGNIYVIAWSIINFLLLALVIAVPILCVVMLFKMNHRLKQLEAKLGEIPDIDPPKDPLH